MFNNSSTTMEKMIHNYCENSPFTLNRYIVGTVVFLIGAIGNVMALWILHKSARTRNKKHVLMLRGLATNDLVAQLGMLLMITVQMFDLVEKYWICVGYVILRGFGLGSGCIAFVMALERWLALTRPFLYQQLITYRVLKRLIVGIWISGAILSYLPLFGLGLFFKKGKCCRYRYATELSDKIYAYIFLVFGTSLCVGISVCNLTVIYELSKFGQYNRILLRRVSRSIINNNRLGCDFVRSVRYQTPEEVAFSKLMAIICIIFVMCWAPQMISIPMAQFCTLGRFCRVFYQIADTLMGIYFVLDPIVYVLQRYKEKGKCFLLCCFSRRSISSNPPSTTTGTPTSVLYNPPSFTVTDVM